ncbi:hypothetical protein B0H12DRAFT_1230606 [Mycena haematopus]|nr:hypothetical protein B0H12DRAFT_1230606 [Mycena haematopus]
MRSSDAQGDNNKRPDKPHQEAPSFDLRLIFRAIQMPASASQRCGDDEERRLRRLATYRKYRRARLDDHRRKARERMARLRANPTEEQRQRHREAQKRYRENCRESIAHRARRAALKKNTEMGKDTKLRPKARQYWSDPDLATSDEEEEDDEW